MAPPDPEQDPERLPQDLSGRTLAGTWRVGPRLAEGGTGSLWLAEEASSRRKVVVKVPPRRFLADPGFRARLRREVTELMRLEHPHLVRILAQGEEAGVPFYVLARLEGGSLEDRLRAGPVGPDAVMEWLPAVARTLDYVHMRGLVHRDVKPANVLFDRSGQVFLSDLALVKALAGEEGGVALQEVGSPSYAAPEQLRGGEITGAADQYALAATVHEALRGEPPFERGSLVEMLLAKERESPPDLSRHVRGLPRAASDAVARALSPDPAARFPSCALFAQALAEVLLPEPAPVVVATVEEPVRRRPRALLTGLAALVLLLGAGAWLVLGSGASEREFGPAGDDRLVVLVHAGEEPRRRLRYHLTSGAAEAVTSRMGNQILELDEEADPFAYGVAQRLRVTVDRVEPRGAADLSWRMSSALTGGEPDDDLEASASAPPEEGGVSGTSRAWPRGQLTEVGRKEGPEGFTGLEPRFEETVPWMTVTFPEAPVGVGAVWAVTQPSGLMGVRFVQSATYTLAAMDGERVTVQIALTKTAPVEDQDAVQLGFGSVQGTVKSVQASGRGEVAVDLDRPLPAWLRLHAAYRLEVEPAEPGEGDGAPRSLALQQDWRLWREGAPPPPEVRRGETREDD